MASLKNSYEYLLSLPSVIPGDDHKACQKALLTFGLRNITLSGVVCEFGVFKGVTARHIISSIPDSTPVYLFDSFDGLPEDWCHKSHKGAFNLDDKSTPVFNEKNVKVIKGLFSDTLEPLPFDGQISFLHMDCDIYSSAKTVFTQCNDRIKPGTVIVFDELYNYDCYDEHEYKALQEWCKEFNRDFEYIGRSNSEQVAIKIIK